MAHEESRKKIIVISGAKEGVGKSFLTANLAFLYAQLTKQRVILYDPDPEVKGELLRWTGGEKETPLSSLLPYFRKEIEPTIPRGKIHFDKYGLGIVSSGSRQKMESTRRYIEAIPYLGHLCDCFIDSEDYYAESRFFLDLADLVFWIFLPDPGQLQSTLKKLEILERVNFNLGKIEFIINQQGLPGELEINDINRYLEKFGKRVSLVLPYREEIMASRRQRELFLVGNPGSGFNTYIRTLVEVLQKQHLEKHPPMSTILEKLRLAMGKEESEEDKEERGRSSHSFIFRERRGQKEINRWDEWRMRIHQRLIEELDLKKINLAEMSDEVKTTVENTAAAVIGKERLDVSREERQQLIQDLVDETLGLGPLEDLLRDPTITEVMVNGYNAVYIERNGKISATDKKFINDAHVIRAIRRIIAPLGRRIDESVPLVDARLADGSRVNAVIPPLALEGPLLTIRRFPEESLTAGDLEEKGTLSSTMTDFLRSCVQIKKNILISGGTGTGKTTFLNILSSFIPHDERIITIEDVAELRLQQAHVGRLEARPPNIEGKGEVTIRDLLRNSLRMRPDRIIVGECRGAEALDMLQAMNTGHEGSLTTVHANSPRDAISRLEMMCMFGERELPVSVLREQISAAIHLIIQLERLRDGTRKIVRVAELVGCREQEVVIKDLFIFKLEGIDEQGYVKGEHQPTGAFPTFLDEFKMKGVELKIWANQKKADVV